MSATTDMLRHRLRSSVPTALRRRVTIDGRSLALFRIVVASLIIADVLFRSRNFHIYYTDDGVVPQSLAESYWATDVFSVFHYTSDPIIIATLFVVGILVALALLIGYHTRTATVLSFLFVVSLDHQNPFVLSYADTLFRMLLLWAVFLPLGERWSVDAIHREPSPRSGIASWASAAIMIQMVFMYVVNAIHKYPSSLWHSGEAAVVVMGIDEVTFLLGPVVRDLPMLLQFGGAVWFYSLLAAPLLVLLSGRARYPLLFVLMIGHASFALTVRIGAFPYVAMAGLTLFVHAQLWRDAKRLLDDVGLSVCIAGVTSRLTWIGYTLANGLPNTRNASVNRSGASQYLVSIAVIILIVGLFVLPALSMAAAGPYIDENPMPDTNPIADAAATFGVSQPSWSIFAAPDPRSVDRYYVFPANTADGGVMDIYNDRPMTYDRPAKQLQKQHDTYRERFYMTHISRAGPADSVPHAYAEHLCETWATERSVEVTHINMYVVTETVSTETIATPDERDRTIDLLFSHGCGDRFPTVIAPPTADDERPPVMRSDV